MILSLIVILRLKLITKHYSQFLTTQHALSLIGCLSFVNIPLILYMFLVLLTSVQIPLAGSIQTLSGAVATASNPLRLEPRRNNSLLCHRHQSPTSSANSSWPCTSRAISVCWPPWRHYGSVAIHGPAKSITFEFAYPIAQHAGHGRQTSHASGHSCPNFRDPRWTKSNLIW